MISQAARLYVAPAEQPVERATKEKTAQPDALLELEGKRKQNLGILLSTLKRAGIEVAKAIARILQHDTRSLSPDILAEFRRQLPDPLKPETAEFTAALAQHGLPKLLTMLDTGDRRLFARMVAEPALQDCMHVLEYHGNFSHTLKVAQDRCERLESICAEAMACRLLPRFIGWVASLHSCIARQNNANAPLAVSLTIDERMDAVMQSRPLADVGNNVTLTHIHVASTEVAGLSCTAGLKNSIPTLVANKEATLSELKTEIDHLEDGLDHVKALLEVSISAAGGVERLPSGTADMHRFTVHAASEIEALRTRECALPAMITRMLQRYSQKVPKDLLSMPAPFCKGAATIALRLDAASKDRKGIEALKAALREG